MKKYYTDSDVHEELQRRLSQRGEQSRIAREIGIPKSNLSTMRKGGPISSRVLGFLGFERAENLYTRTPRQVNDREIAD